MLQTHNSGPVFQRDQSSGSKNSQKIASSIRLQLLTNCRSTSPFLHFHVRSGSNQRPPSNPRRVCLDVPDNSAKKGRSEFNGVLVSLGGNRGTITAARKSRDGSSLSKTFQLYLRKTMELMQSKINIPRSALGKWGFVANLCKSGAVTFGVRPTSILL